MDVKTRIEQSLTGKQATAGPNVDRLSGVERAVARREAAQRWAREGTTAAGLIRQSVQGGETR